MMITLISCNSKNSKTNDNKVKRVIGESYYGTFGIKKMKDIEKLKEDVFSLPVHYSIVEKYVLDVKENDYKIVRHIYKDNRGANRIFYLIDITEEMVVDKSSNSNDFFLPIAEEILGKNLGDIEGNNLLELMRY